MEAFKLLGRPLLAGPRFLLEGESERFTSRSDTGADRSSSGLDS